MRHAVAEQVLEQARDRRLAEEADAERGHRDAELAGRQVLVDAVDLREHERGAAAALVAHLLDARPRVRGRARTRRRRRSRSRPPATRTPSRKSSSVIACRRLSAGYFEEVRRRSSADAARVAKGFQADSFDSPGQLEVVRREPALGVRDERDRHLVPRDRQVRDGGSSSSASGVRRLTKSTEPLKSSSLKAALDRVARPAPSRPGRPGAARSPRRSDVPSLVSMRIASLVPSATEMLFALGLGDRVVGGHPRV